MRQSYVDHLFLEVITLQKINYAIFLMWKAARATSAAPTYFEPYKLEKSEVDYFALVDGGVYANNPTLCAYTEALGILRPAGDDWDHTPPTHRWQRAKASDQ